MATVLKIVSAVYLAFVWLVFALAVNSVPRSPLLGGSDQFFIFLICVGLSIPAVALFAFGQVVGDVRSIRNDIHAMRRYYEPSQREPT